MHQAVCGDYYDESKGYGFLGLAAQERAADRFTGTGGWNPRETYCPGDGEEDGLWQDGADGVEVKAGFPLRFRAAVPGNGSYAVTVTIRGGREGAQGLMLYTGRRNLIKRDIVIRPGEVFSCRFYVRVCEYIPVVGEGAKEDNSVYVTVLGAGKSSARISGLKIEDAQAPTVFIAGDSLVADYDGLYPYNPITTGELGDRICLSILTAWLSATGAWWVDNHCFRDDGTGIFVCKNIARYIFLWNLA